MINCNTNRACGDLSQVCNPCMTNKVQKDLLTILMENLFEANDDITLRQDLDELTGDVNNLRVVVTNNTNNIFELDSTVNSLQRIVDENAWDIVVNSQKIDSLVSEVSNLNFELSGLNSSLANLWNRFLAIEPCVTCDPSAESLVISDTELVFGGVDVGNNAIRTTIATGNNLTNDIEIESSSPYFVPSTEVTNWDPRLGGTLAITFTPDSVGEFIGTITVRSGLISRVISVSGTGTSQSNILIQHQDINLGDVYQNTVKSVDDNIQGINLQEPIAISIVSGSSMFRTALLSWDSMNGGILRISHITGQPTGKYSGVIEVKSGIITKYINVTVNIIPVPAASLSVTPLSQTWAGSEAMVEKSFQVTGSLGLTGDISIEMSDSNWEKWWQRRLEPGWDNRLGGIITFKLFNTDDYTTNVNMTVRSVSDGLARTVQLTRQPGVKFTASANGGLQNPLLSYETTVGNTLISPNLSFQVHPSNWLPSGTNGEFYVGTYNIPIGQTSPEGFERITIVGEASQNWRNISSAGGYGYRIKRTAPYTDNNIFNIRLSAVTEGKYTADLECLFYDPTTSSNGFLYTTKIVGYVFAEGIPTSTSSETVYGNPYNGTTSLTNDGTNYTALRTFTCCRKDIVIVNNVPNVEIIKRVGYRWNDLTGGYILAYSTDGITKQITITDSIAQDGTPTITVTPR